MNVLVHDLAGTIDSTGDLRRSDEITFIDANQVSVDRGGANVINCADDRIFQRCFPTHELEVHSAKAHADCRVAATGVEEGVFE